MHFHKLNLSEEVSLAKVVATKILVVGGKVMNNESSRSKMEFPSEHFVPLEGDEYLLGRLTLNKAHDGLTVEIDIVQKEGRKIFCSVDRLYHLSDVDEALHLGIQKLSEFLTRQGRSK